MALPNRVYTKDTNEIAWLFEAKNGDAIYVTGDGTVYLPSQVRSTENVAAVESRSPLVPVSVHYGSREYFATGKTKTVKGVLYYEMESKDGNWIWMDHNGSLLKSERSDEAAVEKRGAFTYKGIEFWATGRKKTENGRKWYEMESEEAYLIWVDNSGNVVEDKHGFGPSHKISGRRSDDAAVERRPTTHSVTYTASDEDEIESRSDRPPASPIRYEGKDWYWTGDSTLIPKRGVSKYQERTESVFQFGTKTSGGSWTGSFIWVTSDRKVLKDFYG